MRKSIVTPEEVKKLKKEVAEQSIDIEGYKFDIRRITDERNER